MSRASASTRRTLRRVRITGWSALTALLVTIVSFLTWFHIVLPADRGAMDAFFANEEISVVAENGLILATPTGPSTNQGLVFYPGAKVDPYAYLPTFEGLIAQGLTVVVVEPLFNMALFDTTPLSGATSLAPGITQWFVGGHSLGGVRACMVADDPAVSGVVLMASFCANDLSQTDLTILQLFGDKDGLIDPVAVAEASALLPISNVEYTLAGANHASFGAYGPQGGDGIATANRSEVFAMIQATITTNLLTD